MKDYFKYIFMLAIVLFSFYYTDRVFEFSLNNNTILASINEYAQENDTKCIEGSINENGIILGLSGLKVNKNKSYSNMKGNGFKDELIEYEKEECILSKENNLDKYIISGNNINKNISLVIDIVNQKYYEKMMEVFENNNISYNLLVNDNFKNNEYETILYKGDNIKSFKKQYNNIYCVKTNDYEIINDCKKYKINSIRMINYIDSKLYTNIKKLLNNGNIIFIKESNLNLNELEITIKYITSRGFNIVDINDLLS
ncbi:MAG: hypothetical protein PUA90_02200 [bacterium]|nr:hypothetical protein [bacterium]